MANGGTTEEAQVLDAPDTGSVVVWRGSEACPQTAALEPSDRVTIWLDPVPTTNVDSARVRQRKIRRSPCAGAQPSNEPEDAQHRLTAHNLSHCRTGREDEQHLNLDPEGSVEPARMAD